MMYEGLSNLTWVLYLKKNYTINTIKSYYSHFLRYYPYFRIDLFQHSVSFILQF